ncbi:hypothetical protein DL771_005183 [Monosporascus sp. 5C6A]|nr:hypothetical protein DL771_005183 [Monosporascus sp. 5C6A]
MTGHRRVIQLLAHDDTENVNCALMSAFPVPRTHSQSLNQLRFLLTLAESTDIIFMDTLVGEGTPAFLEGRGAPFGLQIQPNDMPQPHYEGLNRALPVIQLNRKLAPNPNSSLRSWRSARHATFAYDDLFHIPKLEEGRLSFNQLGDLLLEKGYAKDDPDSKDPSACLHSFGARLLPYLLAREVWERVNAAPPETFSIRYPKYSHHVRQKTREVVLHNFYKLSKRTEVFTPGWPDLVTVWKQSAAQLIADGVPQERVLPAEDAYHVLQIGNCSRKTFRSRRSFPLGRIPEKDTHKVVISAVSADGETEDTPSSTDFKTIGHDDQEQSDDGDSVVIENLDVQYIRPSDTRHYEALASAVEPKPTSKKKLTELGDLLADSSDDTAATVYPKAPRAEVMGQHRMSTIRVLIGILRDVHKETFDDLSAGYADTDFWRLLGRNILARLDPIVTTDTTAAKGTADDEVEALKNKIRLSMESGHAGTEVWMHAMDSGCLGQYDNKTLEGGLELVAWKAHSSRSSSRSRRVSRTRRSKWKWDVGEIAELKDEEECFIFFYRDGICFRRRDESLLLHLPASELSGDPKALLNQERLSQPEATVDGSQISTARPNRMRAARKTVSLEEQVVSQAPLRKKGRASSKLQDCEQFSDTEEHIQRGLKSLSKPTWTQEQRNWVIKTYPNGSAGWEKIAREFNAHSRTSRSPNAFKQECINSLGWKPFSNSWMFDQRLFLVRSARDGELWDGMPPSFEKKFGVVKMSAELKAQHDDIRRICRSDTGCRQAQVDKRCKLQRLGGNAFLTKPSAEKFSQAELGPRSTSEQRRWTTRSSLPKYLRDSGEYEGSMPSRLDSANIKRNIRGRRTHANEPTSSGPMTRPNGHAKEVSGKAKKDVDWNAVDDRFEVEFRFRRTLHSLRTKKVASPEAQGTDPIAAASVSESATHTTEVEFVVLQSAVVLQPGGAGWSTSTGSSNESRNKRYTPKRPQDSSPQPALGSAREVMLIGGKKPSVATHCSVWMTPNIPPANFDHIRDLRRETSSAVLWDTRLAPIELRTMPITATPFQGSTAKMTLATRAVAEQRVIDEVALLRLNASESFALSAYVLTCSYPL